MHLSLGKTSWYLTWIILERKRKSEMLEGERERERKEGVIGSVTFSWKNSFPPPVVLNSFEHIFFLMKLQCQQDFMLILC